jgi:hypothetical protein
MRMARCLKQGARQILPQHWFIAVRRMRAWYNADIRTSPWAYP